MIDNSTPVELAMQDNRPPKQTVRTIWMNAVKEVDQDEVAGNEPLYMTLPGSQGIDIQMLIDEGLVALTEVGSIAQADQYKIIAVERSSRSVADLRRNFIGLKIREVDVRGLVRGEGRTRWPEGDDINLCRARVINLDLNSSLYAEMIDNELVFPILTWIDKLSRIHANPPRIDWTLLLTLHAEIRWPEGAANLMRNFLKENVEREDIFSENCRSFLGDELFEIATEDIDSDLSQLTQDYQQRLMMVMVPKLIAHAVHNDGWIVDILYNLRYGGGEFAPMVTWVVKFRRAQDAAFTPDAVYKHALQGILRNTGMVTEEGELQVNNLEGVAHNA